MIDDDSTIKENLFMTFQWIFFCRKSNRRTEGRVDGSEDGEGDKVALYSAI